MEVYKIINGFEKYSISNFGNIKNNLTNRIMKLEKSRTGYYMIKLNKQRKQIHRLVAEAFIPNPNNKPVVDHINNLRDDNRVENLRWASFSENSANMRISKNNSSGVKGVSIENNKFRAVITHNGKKQHLGFFETLEEAMKARQKKAKELFKEYTNECETKTNDIVIKVPKNQKVKITIEIDPEQKELEELERELQEIINRN